MDANTWQLDERKRVLAHSSGLVLRFQGTPGTNSFGFNPLVIPEGMPPLELARLIRLGVNFFSQSLAAQAC